MAGSILGTGNMAVDKTANIPALIAYILVKEWTGERGDEFEKDLGDVFGRTDWIQRVGERGGKNGFSGFQCGRLGQSRNRQTRLRVGQFWTHEYLWSKRWQVYVGV